MNTPFPAEQKTILRREIVARRDALSADWRASASALLCSHIATLPEISQAKSVAAFWPLAGEVDLRPLMENLSATGRCIALPVMTGETLVFRAWQPGAALTRKPFGVMEPDAKAAVVQPEVILVPLAAFDRSGTRLGYGKGFYDRALAGAQHPRAPMTIGVAFAMQEQVALPREPHDQPLRMIVTEAETIRVAE